MYDRFRPRILSAALLGLLAALDASAQTYPSSTPTYIPTAVLPGVSLTAPGTVVFQSNGIGTVRFDITGTNTGLALTFQGSVERSGTVTWVTLGALQDGVGGEIANIVADGGYEVKAAGYAQIRANVTALSTGTVTIAAAGTPGAGRVSVTPTRRQTYSAAITGLTPAASATDFFTIAGSATTTVRIQRVACSGTSTAAASATIQALRRSTANATGTSTTLTDANFDSADQPGAAVVKAYTANPGTLGTLVGVLRSGVLTTQPLASSAANVPVFWEFGHDQAEEVILRGVAQTFALNANAASFAAGTSLNCDVQWTEQ